MDIDNNKLITISRNCDATMIPAGEKIVNNKAAGIPKVIRYVGAGFFGILMITN